jgi:hypothetical protein
VIFRFSGAEVHILCPDVWVRYTTLRHAFRLPYGPSIPLEETTAIGLPDQLQEYTTTGELSDVGPDQINGFHAAPQIIGSNEWRNHRVSPPWPLHSSRCDRGRCCVLRPMQRSSSIPQLRSVRGALPAYRLPQLEQNQSAPSLRKYLWVPHLLQGNSLALQANS